MKILDTTETHKALRTLREMLAGVTGRLEICNQEQIAAVKLGDALADVYTITISDTEEEDDDATRTEYFHCPEADGDRHEATRLYKRESARSGRLWVEVEFGASPIELPHPPPRIARQEAS
ncbi:MAG: hypothetical protein K8R90_05295 [Candidatus Cloacimonetes bacterium]|nr:hypothetical protein [Candidatus Cloacimonadota bacterium]